MRQQQAFDRVLAGAGAQQQELRAAADDGQPVADELFQQGLERQDPRLAVDQRQEDDRERILQGRELVELVEHDLGIGVALQLEHQPHGLLQIAFVANRRDALDAVLVHQGRDALFHAIARLLEGDFRDQDALAVLAELLDPGASPQGDRAAAGVIAAANAAAAANDAARGKVGAGADLQQLVNRDVGVVDHANQRLANFAQVVRRNRRGHAHRDAVGAVDQQVGKLRGEDRGLGVPLVVGGHVVDGVELEIFEHHRRDWRHAGLGVSHGRGGQPGDGAKVALLVDQHVPHVPLLGHADQGGIDDSLAVRMVVTAGVAGDLGALDAAGARREVQIVHGHQDAPLRGLEAVAHIGQSAADNDAHRIGEVAVLQLVLDGQLDRAAEQGIGSGRALTRLGGLGGLVVGHVRLVSVGGQNQSFPRGFRRAEARGGGTSAAAA